jgi:hypothetical protein
MFANNHHIQASYYYLLIFPVIFIKNALRNIYLIIQQI